MKKTSLIRLMETLEKVLPSGMWGKRIVDVVLSVSVVIVFGFPILLLSLLVKLVSPGPILHWSSRIGLDNKVFKMPKFRTMRVDTPLLATHLLTEPDRFVTPLGGFLRKTSLDEIPQLFSIFRGDMSFVGPRPALFNQYDLITLRTAKGVHRIPPGLTGWAQVNGRDNLPIPLKVDYDEYYLNHRSLFFDFVIIFMTVGQVLYGKGVSH